MITLETVKTYCRIDGTGEDALLLGMMDSARAYLQTAGVEELDDSRYDLAVCALTLEAYDNRGMSGVSSTLYRNAAAERLIHQLKLECEARRNAEDDA